MNDPLPWGVTRDTAPANDDGWIIISASGHEPGLRIRSVDLIQVIKDTARLRAVASWLHDGGFHVRCGCRPDTHAVSHVKRRGDSLFFARNPSSVEHSHSCPLYNDLRLTSGVKPEVIPDPVHSSSIDINNPSPGLWALLRTLAQKAGAATWTADGSRLTGKDWVASTVGLEAQPSVDLSGVFRAKYEFVEDLRRSLSASNSSSSSPSTFGIALLQDVSTEPGSAAVSVSGHTIPLRYLRMSDASSTVKQIALLLISPEDGPVAAVCTPYAGKQHPLVVEWEAQRHLASLVMTRMVSWAKRDVMKTDMALIYDWTAGALAVKFPNRLVTIYPHAGTSDHSALYLPVGEDWEEDSALVDSALFEIMREARHLP